MSTTVVVENEVTNIVTITTQGPQGIPGNPTLLMGQVNGYTKQQYFSQSTLTDGATISWNLDSAQTAKVTLNHSTSTRQLNTPTNIKAGGNYVLAVYQDSTGGAAMTFGAAYKWPSGAAPVLSTNGNAVDLLAFYSPDGAIMLGTAVYNYS